MFLLNDDTLSSVVKILVDGAYIGEDFASQVKAILGGARWRWPSAANRANLR